MSAKISHDPINERELIDTKEFINGATAAVDKIIASLKDVMKHHELLEEFSYMYKEQDIDAFWLMRIWPLRIAVAV